MTYSRLSAFLDEQHARYKTTIHSPAYTAQETAQSSHIHGMDFMKTVIAKVDGEFIMLVIPAPYRIDLPALAEALEVDQVELASEADFYELFPMCELGAMPPFGNLFDMQTYVAPCFSGDQIIAFNAGTHAELIEMRFDDFIGVVEPHILEGGYSAPTVTARKMKEHGRRFKLH